jgi:hypothetical protein
MEEVVGSIPTAPTIHLPHGWTLNKSTRGQKVADRSDDPVLVFFAAARVTTGHAVSVSIDILRRPFLATFRFANNPRTTHLMDTSAYSGTDSLNLLAAAVTVSGIQVLSTKWKSTDGTASHWKYILGNVIVYRDVYRGRSTPHLGGQVRRHVDLYRRPATEL